MLERLVASYAYSPRQFAAPLPQLESSALPSNAQRIPFVVPLAEIDGVGAAYAKDCALCDVGEVEIRPLLLALSEYALIGKPAPAQYRLPFQYAGEPQMPLLAPTISCT